MEPGEVLVQSQPRGRWLPGLRRERLWFAPFTGPAEVALESGARGPGFRCHRCGLLVVERPAAGR